MISVDFQLKSKEGGVQGFARAIQQIAKKLDTNELAEVAATILISRVRRRYMKQLNPDGSKWPVSKAAKWRARGELTWADGGKYAPGGWKTGGFTLFSSGNLFHSIQLSREGNGVYAVKTDVGYAKKYMKLPRIIIGYNKKDISLMSAALKARLTL
ncbi:MAG: hypothetical protein GWN00_01410 [Aliifodinibius sp.]|nr:hypothetical protein [Phycisphaerae bacterium]NIR62338.1 hypothetical protein [candidate division Zixibacteria bacterium]NIT54936.1 hypothetical protein [Fodinibius sp.]NIW43350.1 hypothetical protein [Gammaproteobacteria bacterium]NIU12571.1 hypothetical protein [candidate division Zixibacteria bacterium]